MGNRAIRPHMDIQDRAKQFMPFDALRGFREALIQKEKIVVPKIELSEFAKDELDKKFHEIGKGDIIKIVYFNNGEYIEMTGMVSKLEISSRLIRVVNTKIKFDDIYRVEKCQSN